MARKLYISDCHFFHDILNREMDRRGFSDAKEMNDYMIRQWNRAVGPKDEVYILGDFSYGKAQETAEVLKKLPGKLYLIRGNHDYFINKLDEESAKRFVWIKPYAEVRDSGRRLVLSHYPVFCYNGQYHRNKKGESNVYMLYGHVHDTKDERLVNSFIMQTRNTNVVQRRGDEPSPLPCQMINCFTMFSDYMPLTLDQWIEKDAERREKMMTETL